MSPPVSLHEFLPGYLAEVDEHLRSATTELTAIDAASKKGEALPRSVRSLFRSLHTIKGLSAMLGVEPIVDVAHAMETQLRDADRAGGRLPPRAIEPLLAGLRAIQTRVSSLSRGEDVAKAPEALLRSFEGTQLAEHEPRTSTVGLNLPEQVSSKLTDHERAELSGAAASGKTAYRAEFRPSSEKAAKGVSITHVRERVSSLGDLVRVLPLSVAGKGSPAGLSFLLLFVSSAPMAELEATGIDDIAKLAGTESSSVPEELPPESLEEPVTRQKGFVRVDVARMDESLDRLSSLVVSRLRLGAEVAKLAERGVDVRDLRVALDEDARRMRDLRSALLSLRMIRLREVLEPLPLLVRGLAISARKQVRLDVDTGDAELDKSVAERILPALVHLIRNAIDHGLEGSAERATSGKPELGTITVRASARGGRDLELIVSDDGRGVNAIEVAKRAKASTPRNDAELLDLLTRPGLSTRDQADTTSGRGLGMDIVRRVAEELGGELRFENRPGEGATFTMRVPVTVTVLDALRVECGTERFVVPVAAVEEVFELDETRASTGPKRERGVHVRMLERRGEALTLVSLRAMLGLGESGGETRGVLVRRHGEPFAFAVDKLAGKSEVVVRPLRDPLLRVSGISGAADLGDGSPTLVLDLLMLAHRLRSRGAEA